MKILLINPVIREWAKPNVLPLGLAYIATALRNEGFEVEVLDINAFRWSKDEVEQKIKNIQCDVFGIGAIVTVYGYVKWLAEIIKFHHPESPIIIGGSVGTSIPQIILSKTKADIVCIGEGEVTVVELMNTLRCDGDLSNVNGIYYKGIEGQICTTAARESIKDLDTIPLPAWDLFPMETYLKNPVGAPNRNKWDDGAADSDARTMNIQGTRGCPYKCIYCYHDFMGTRYRHRSPARIIDEIRILYEEYGVTYVHFIDDELVLKKSFVMEFCRLLKGEFGQKITWGCTGRVNLMTEELISAMVGAGCVSIGYGIESGSQKILDNIKKGVTVEQAKQAIKMTKQQIGWADCSFMFGAPGETRETIQETIDFCKELDLTPEVIFFTTPYPGTELYDYARKLGKIPDEEAYILGLGEQGEKIRINFTDLTDEELYKFQTEAINELNAWNKIRHPEAR